MAELPRIVEPRRAVQWRVDGETCVRDHLVPDEAAIGLSYDSTPHVVLMGTAADIEDLAVGFSITEGIARADEIADVRVAVLPEGIAADILLDGRARPRAHQARARTLEGRTSCGLCGVQHLRDAVRPLPRVDNGLTITRAAIQRALADLAPAQRYGEATRAMHAAAWARPDGALAFVREDVGRHNALDKTIGAAARAGADPGRAFLVVTSRCSYEMVEKAAFAGAPALVAVSAPTAMAIRRAEEAGITLVALARADGHIVFAGAERVVA